jgi:AhpD family alkylhydroperoxidase
MTETLYPSGSRELNEMRKRLAPEAHDAFQAFGAKVFADGALPSRTKQIIAVAVAHVTQCPYCIKGHTKAALRAGATPEELMEAVWVAAEMRAGAAYAHSVVALATIEEEESRRERQREGVGGSAP